MKKLVLVVMAISTILNISPNVKGDEALVINMNRYVWGKDLTQPNQPLIITEGEEMCSLGVDGMMMTIPCDLIPVNRGYLKSLKQKIQELERRTYELEGKIYNFQNKEEGKLYYLYGMCSCTSGNPPVCICR